MTLILPRLNRRDYDYILVVSSLTTDGWPARVKDVAAKMKVKPPTAVEILERLKGLALVEKGPVGYKLSEKGAMFNQKIVRTHRLFETLLTRNGIRLEDACKISTSVQGELGEEAIAKLCSHLSHPDACPHGRPIPAGDSYD